MRTLSICLFILCCSSGFACSNTQSSAESPNDVDTDDSGANIGEGESAMDGEDEGLPPPTATDNAERPELTQQECEESGGEIVGDIGDGAIHKSDYLCPSGSPPSGTIKAPEGGPIGVEGSVCCM